MDFTRLFDFITLKQRFSGIAFAFCLLFTMQPAQAGLIDSTPLDTEILGGRFFVVNNGDVTATFLGSDASYYNRLYLVFPDETVDPLFIFDRNYSGPGISLGSFDAGTELVFRLDVRPAGPGTDITDRFFTGNGSNNLDDLAHALAVTTLVGENYLTTVGFEDIYGGGDRDYNDFEFALTNVIDPRDAVVPEPRLLLLLSCGLFILTLFSRRRKILNSADI